MQRIAGILALVRRDVRLAVREGGAIGTALGFFLIVVSLMPLGGGRTSSPGARRRPGRAAACGPFFSRFHFGDGLTRTARSKSLATGPVAAGACCCGEIARTLAYDGHSAGPFASTVLGILLNLDLKSHPILIATMPAGTPTVSFLRRWAQP